MYTPTCRQLTKTTQHLWGEKWRKKADVAQCWAEIFQHIADMWFNTSMLRQNCRRQHPTNPTKQIEMPDGDEIDDIEEACVNEDSPPPRNRQRLSC